MGILVAAVAAALAAWFCWKAVQVNLKPLKRWPAAGFWAALTIYMAAFAALRLFHLLDWPGLVALYHIATVAGASTVVFLMYILAGVIFGHPSARWGAEFGAVAATWVLTLIFTGGVAGPRIRDASIEFLPMSASARIAIAAVYIAAPLVMVVLAWVATQGSADTALRRRSFMFSAAVLMIYLPNAFRYVMFIEGPLSVSFAVVMCGGALIGWRSYHVT